MFVSENSSLKNFVNFQEKHPHESAFLPGIYWECFRGKFKTFSEQLSQKTPAIGGFCIVTEKRFNQNILKNISSNFGYLCFDIQ